jgi:hypothetical protein
MCCDLSIGEFCFHVAQPPQAAAHHYFCAIPVSAECIRRRRQFALAVLYNICRPNVLIINCSSTSHRVLTINRVISKHIWLIVEYCAGGTLAYRIAAFVFSCLIILPFSSHFFDQQV